MVGETRTLDQLPLLATVSPEARMLVSEPGGAQGAIPIKSLMGKLISTETAAATVADLAPQLDYEANATSLVYADPDPFKNGWYRKDGGRGVGRWVQFEILTKVTRETLLTLSGEGPPAASLGAPGQFYRDLAAGTEYGPKTDAGWGEPRSLVGPAGAAGNTYTSYAALQQSDPARRYAYLTGDTDANPRADGPYSNASGVVGEWKPQGASGVQTSIGRTVEQELAPLRPTLNVESFRMPGDGDRDVLRKAFAAWMAQGGGILSADGTRRYNLGEIGVYTSGDKAGQRIEELFPIDGLRDAHFATNGARFVVKTLGVGPLPIKDNPRQPRIFLFRDFRNLTVSDLNIEDLNADLTVEWQGMKAVVANSDKGPCSGLELRNLRVTNAVSAFEVQGGTGASRITDIAYTGTCIFTRCYYGSLFQEGGDRVRGGYTAIDCRRYYFAYGMRDHELSVSVFNTSGANTAVGGALIKRYTQNTRGVTLRLTYDGPLKYRNLVEVEHQPPVGTLPGASRIDDVDVTIRLGANAEWVPGFEAQRLGFYSYAGEALEAETDNIIGRVTLRGDLGPRNLDAAHMIRSYTRFKVPPRIALDPGVKGLRLDMCDVENVAIQMSTDRLTYLKRGNLTTSALTIPTRDAANFQVELMVTAEGDVTALAQQHVTFERVMLLGYNAGGDNAYLAIPPDVERRVVAGTGAVFTYDTNGENITVNVAGAEYAGANARLRVDAQFVGSSLERPQ